MEARDAGPHVVILGGFLTEPLFYRRMRARLLERGAARVTVAQLHLPDWLALSFSGMGPLMLRGARAIREARRESPAPLLVIGHSAGGIVARLAMSPGAFEGRRISVADDVACLVTLGTPHRIDPRLARWQHAGVRANAFLDRVTPGAWFAPRTAYLSVGSTLVASSPLRLTLRPGGLAHLITRIAVGQTIEARGDGLVDVTRVHLAGAQQLTFDDVLHGTVGGPWYGDGRIIDRWWPLAVEAWREALHSRAHQAAVGAAQDLRAAGQTAGISSPAGPPTAPRPASAMPTPG